jgi:hypothetical protein
MHPVQVWRVPPLREVVKVNSSGEVYKFTSRSYMPDPTATIPPPWLSEAPATQTAGQYSCCQGRWYIPNCLYILMHLAKALQLASLATMQ